MPGVILNFEVIDRTPIKLLKRELNRMRRESMRELAQWFHEELVERRFTPGNETRYQHESRNQVYKDRIKKRRGTGQGKFVNNVLSGISKRRALAFPKVTATSNQANLRVETPTYFRRPFKGTYRNPRTGRITNINRQPDKVAETVRISEEEKKQIRDRLQRILNGKLADLSNGNEQRRKL